MRRNVLATLLALTLGLVALRSAGARAAAPPAPRPAFDVTPAVEAIEEALAAIEETSPEAWRAPAARDALTELVAAARDIAAEARSIEDPAALREGLGHVAWLLTLALARVDGEAGVSENAWRDDWTDDPATTAALHRAFLGARATVLRLAP